MRKPRHIFLFIVITLLVTIPAHSLSPYHSANELTGGTITGDLKIAQQAADCNAGISLASGCLLRPYILLSPTASNFPGTLTVGGKNICLSDGTNCPAAAAQVWQQSSNNIYYANGNVGIGTNNPSQKLEVNGAVAISTYTYVQATRVSCKVCKTADRACTCPSGTPYCASGAWVDSNGNGLMDVGTDLCVQSGVVAANSAATALAVGGNVAVTQNITAGGSIRASGLKIGATPLEAYNYWSSPAIYLRGNEHGCSGSAWCGNGQATPVCSTGYTSVASGLESSRSGGSSGICTCYNKCLRNDLLP